MKKINFETTEEYRDYLQQRFAKVDNAGRYNIFLHAITNYTSCSAETKGRANEDIKMKLESILKNGFLLDGYSNFGAYGSMNGTSKFVGEINSAENFDKVVNYHYDNNQLQEYSVTLIMAIPKYIDTGDNIYELSSVDGDLHYGGTHKKECLYDVVKGMYLPKSFNLGVQIINNETGEVVFLDNEEHISSKSQHAQESELKDYATSVKKCVEKYSKDGHIDWQEVFKKETDQHMDSIADFYYSID